MIKSATVQARVSPDLKIQVDKILKTVGTTSSQVINALYAQIIMQKGVPFELKIPNQMTLEAMKELENGGGKSFSSFKEMMDDLEKE